MAARVSRRLLFSSSSYSWQGQQMSCGSGGLRRWIHSARVLLSKDVSRRKLSPLQERKMVDTHRLYVRGGQGGAGCTSMRKSRLARHGFADGGNGGTGGSVILVSSAAVWDFSNMHHHLNGKNGGAGSSKRRAGSRGADKVVQVPVGTVMHLLEGSLSSLEPPLVIPDESSWSTLERNFSRSTVVHSQDSPETDTEADDSVELAEASVSDNHQPSDGGLTSEAVVCADDGHPDKEVDPSSHQLTDPVIVAADNEEVDASSSQPSDPDIESPDNEEVEASSHQITDPGTETADDGEHMPLPIRSCVVEFVKPGQSVIVASGGRGGRGNVSMGKTKGGLPRLEHEQGHPGTEAVLLLELKSLADVGLVGMPNAGKSTLLGALSRARPAVGHYAFTTLRPNIGKVEFEDFFSLTVADIPGLIEGAHQNKGLGHDFLRHIERTKVLAYVVDLAGGLRESKGLPPWEQLRELMYELEQYQAGLSRRRSLVVANKIDEEGAEIVLEELRRKVPGMPVCPTCAVLGDGIHDLKEALRDLVDVSESQASEPVLL